MSSIRDILAKKNVEEPPEVRLIKEYVAKNFDANVGVLVAAGQITVRVPGAALASTLQSHRHELTKVCRTDKRIVIQIS